MAKEVYRIEIPIETVDKYSNELDKAEKEVKDFEKSVDKAEKSSKKLKNTAKKSAAAVEKVGDSAGKSEARVSKFQSTIDKTKKRLDKLKSSRGWQFTIKAKDQASKVISGINSFIHRTANRSYNFTVGAIDRASRVIGAIKNALFSIPTMITVTLGVIGINKLSQSTLGAAMNFEGYEVAMTHWLDGNKQQADELIKWMGRFADMTPYSSADLFPALARGVGVADGDVKEAQKLLEIAANMTALTPGKTVSDSMEALADARVGEFARLTEYGFKISKKEFDEIGWTGVIRQIDETFKDGAKKFSETAAGQLATIRGYISTLFREAGFGILDSMKPRLERITGWLDNNQDKWSEWKETVQKAGEEAAEWVFSKLESAFDYVRENYLENEEFRSLDFEGKVKFIMDDIGNWWDEKGRPWLADVSKDVGSAIFDGIVWGIKEGVKGIGEMWSDAFKNPSLGGFAGAGIATAIATALASMVLSPILKLLGKVFEALNKAGKWLFNRGATKTATSNAVNNRVHIASASIKFWPSVQDVRVLNWPAGFGGGTSGTNRRRASQGARGTRPATTPKTPPRRRGRRAAGFTASPIVPGGFDLDLKGALKRLPGLNAAFAIFDGITGWDRAKDNFNTNKPTTGQKFSSSAGSIVSGLTFGLVDEGDASKFIYDTGKSIGDGLSDLWDGVKRVASDTFSFIKKDGTENMQELDRNVTTSTSNLPRNTRPAMAAFKEQIVKWFGEARTGGAAAIGMLPNDVSIVGGNVITRSSQTLSPMAGIYNRHFTNAKTSGIQAVTGLPVGVGGVLGTVSGISSRTLGALSPIFLANMARAKNSGVQGVSGLPSGIAGIISRIAPSANQVFGGLLKTFSGWGSRLANAVTSAFNMANARARSLSSSVGGSISRSTKPVKAYASGGLITRPHLGLVGEAGPEMIIPLSSERRNRALELYRRTGQMLGVRQYADGGLVGPRVPVPTGQPAVAGISIGNITISPIVSVEVSGDGDLSIISDEIVDEVGVKLAEKVTEALSNMFINAK